MKIITKEISKLSTTIVNDKKDYVVLALLRIHCISDDDTMGTVGEVAFHFKQDTENVEFISYENLTQDIIFSWCENDIEQWNSMIAFFDSQFNVNKSNQSGPVLRIPPWIQQPPSSIISNQESLQNIELPNNVSLTTLKETLDSTNIPDTSSMTNEQALLYFIEKAVAKILQEKNVI